jgi:hypothetical protein
VTSNAPTLLPLAEVQARLGAYEQHYGGVRPIPVSRIVGTLDRTVTLDRRFRSRNSRDEARLMQLRAAYPDNDFPPINVYEVGGAYFVVDGHHRVALSRERGLEYVEAEVIEVATKYQLDPSVDMLTLIHSQEHRRFMVESGLAVAHPESRFELLRPDGYRGLLAVVQAYGYRCSVEAGRLLSPAETAALWYEREYEPAVAAIREAGLDTRYDYKTDADLSCGSRDGAEPCSQ